MRTRINESGRNRPARYGPAPTRGSENTAFAAQIAELIRSGLDPSMVAARALAAIREDELYVFTHTGAEWRAELRERFDAILAAMDRAATS